MGRFSYLRYASGLMVLLGSLPAYPASPANSITVTNESGVAVSNYPLQFGRPFLDGAIANEPQVLIGGTAVTTQADVKNRYPRRLRRVCRRRRRYPEPSGERVVDPDLSKPDRRQQHPADPGADAEPRLHFSAQMILAPSAGGKAQSVDARTMLANGDYKLWTSGPVAQTIMLADDSPTRKYDIGFGDGYHPFRPRYYATFWPATHQVFVRAVGENGLSTELEDLAYSLTLTGANAKVYSRANLTDPAMSIWTERFWLGGTPQAQVNVNYNLAYLESTRFVANYNASLDPSGAIALEYQNYYTGVPHDLYDGAWDGGAWASGMGAPGRAAGHRPDADLGPLLALYRRLADAAGVTDDGRPGRRLADECSRDRPDQTAARHRSGPGRGPDRHRLWLTVLDDRPQDDGAERGRAQRLSLLSRFAGRARLPTR